MNPQMEEAGNDEMVMVSMKWGGAEQEFVIQHGEEAGGLADGSFKHKGYSTSAAPSRKVPS